jgi:hypothetical protein
VVYHRDYCILTRIKDFNTEGEQNQKETGAFNERVFIPSTGHQLPGHLYIRKNLQWSRHELHAQPTQFLRFAHFALNPLVLLRNNDKGCSHPLGGLRVKWIEQGESTCSFLSCALVRLLTHIHIFDLLGTINSTLGMTALVCGITRSVTAGCGL